MATTLSPVLVKVANPQGGMDPKSDPKSDAKSTNPTSDEPKQHTVAEGLVEQLAELDLDRHVSKKAINQIMIPAHHHDERKLFVGGIPATVTDAEFLDVFQQYGEVIDSVVMIDRTTKRSRGFGFVTFAKAEVASSLLNSIPGKTGMVTIHGKNCELKASEPKSMNSDAPRYIHSGMKPTPYATKPVPRNMPATKGYGYHNPGHGVVPNESYYDSRNFDQLYNGSGHQGYTTSSPYGGYPYSGWEQQGAHYSSYPYVNAHQYPSSQGYYPPQAGGTYNQYMYPAQATNGYAPGYPMAGYYRQSVPDYSGQLMQGEYRGDGEGSLESYPEAYYEDGGDDDE
uniref:RRM domain-containing protein n=1 Tax=Stephanocyclus meneghinianus TaxID=29205 RepID=A0A7S1KL69_STEMN|mmetsp:Transcript_210/g.261  ORF Transcript_210/g.261 Transcript_210/m.261 type:complete len:340 (+) Transcript_210:315-1334(+)|eukprot:scaffold56389_cov75-Cyclotella_meneghiniana.AAC.5